MALWVSYWLSDHQERAEWRDDTSGSSAQSRHIQAADYPEVCLSIFKPNFSSQRFPDLIPCFYSLALTLSFPCDRRFAQGLQCPSSRLLPDSLSPVGDVPTLFLPFTTICSLHLVFFILWYELFSLLNSCFSITLFTLLCFLLFRRQNLSPDGLRSSVSKAEIRLGVCTWTGIDTHKGGEGRKPEMKIGFERAFIHSVTIDHSGLNGSPQKDTPMS